MKKGADLLEETINALPKGRRLTQSEIDCFIDFYLELTQAVECICPSLELFRHGCKCKKGKKNEISANK